MTISVHDIKVHQTLTSYTHAYPLAIQNFDVNTENMEHWPPFTVMGMRIFKRLTQWGNSNIFQEAHASMKVGGMQRLSVADYNFRTFVPLSYMNFIGLCSLRHAPKKMFVFPANKQQLRQTPNRARPCGPTRSPTRRLHRRGSLTPPMGQTPTKL